MPMSMLLIALLLSAHPITASPVPHDGEIEGVALLVPRECAVPCGYSSQYCCSTGQVCFTDANNQAQCKTGQVVSTVVVVTQTPAAATTACRTDLGLTQCGAGCCDAGQVCQGNGVCVGGQTTVTLTAAPSA